MNHEIARSIEPLYVSYTLSFGEDDLLRAFTAPADPDEQLFYDLFSRKFHQLETSAQLTILSRVAALAEAATRLNLEASAPQPKE